MHDGAPQAINGHNPNQARKECRICTHLLRTRTAGDASETFCPFCERVEREERRLQREYEEMPHHRHVRHGKTAKDREATRRFENDLRAQPSHSVFVTGIYKRNSDDTNHAGIQVEITVNRTLERTGWLQTRERITISATATHPTLYAPSADSVMRPAISQAVDLSPRSIRRLRKIGELVTFTFVNKDKEKRYLSCNITRSPELLWFLRVHGIISPCRVNRTKGRLSASERHHIEAEHALPTSELHPCRLRRENRSGHRGHEYGVTVKNDNRLFRQARAQRKDRDMQSSFSPHNWIDRRKEALLSPSSDNEVERRAGKYGEPLPQSAKPSRATRTREALAARARRYN